MKLKCPYCGSENIAWIIWGSSNTSVAADVKYPVIFLEKPGTDESPTRQCRDCHRRFGRRRIYTYHGKKYMPEDVCMVEFQIGGYFGGYNQLVIRRMQGYSALCVLHMPIDRDSPLYIRKYGKKEWDALMNMLFNRLFIQEWKSEYDDNDILDGTQWHLKIGFTDGKSRKIYGSNEYPALWKQLEKRFFRYIGEMRTKEAEPKDILEYYHLFGNEDYSGIWIREHIDELQCKNDAD